ncbi:MAG: sensor histidine kinase [Halobaculum sp.]
MTPGDPAGGVSSESDRLQSLYAATRELVAARTRADLCEAVVDTAESVLGLPYVGIYLRQEDRLVPVSVTAAVEERFDGDLPVFDSAHPLWDVYADGETLRAAETAEWEHSVAAGAAVPVPDHGVLLAGSEDPASVDEAGVELVRLLGTNAAVALDRLERERRLDRLHEAARELMTATDTASVAATATDTAHEVLGLTVNAVFLRASETERLVPVGVTAEARSVFDDEVPALGPETASWEAYATGEPQLYDDIRAADGVESPASALRSVLVLPLGDHGVFVAGSTAVGAFDQSDRSLAQVFAANVEAALDAADRQARLRRRESQLQRQNERLEEFASVVSHDLRNPLNVAAGQVELAAAVAETEEAQSRLDEALEAHEQMESLIEDLLSLARHGHSVGETEPVELAGVARDEWSGTGAGELTVEEGVGTVSADRSRLRELLGNLLRNAAEHAGPDVTVTLGPLEDDHGFYVADDGPGIDPEERAEVFERGYTTAEEGTGYGLAIVADVVAAHGWEIDLVESAAGGARFEVRTDPEE